MKLIIFDMDGTLISSKKVYVNAFDTVFEKFDYDFKKSAAKEFFGPPIAGVVKKVFRAKRKRLSRMELIKITDEVNSYLKSAGMKDIVLCPGVKEFLRKLKGVKKVLITNSHKVFVKAVFKKYKFGRWDLLLTADSRLKGKAAKARYALKKFKVGKEEVLYVGDMVADMKAAREVGVKGVMVFNKCAWTWPDKSKVKKAKPDAIIKRLSELFKYLK